MNHSTVPLPWQLGATQDAAAATGTLHDFYPIDTVHTPQDRSPPWGFTNSNDMGENISNHQTGQKMVVKNVKKQQKPGEDMGFSMIFSNDT